MKTEPDWVEHDGSAVCPVPAGHDVEVRFRNGRVSRNFEPEKRRGDWDHNFIKMANGNPYDITHYRDWTAFEQQQASAEVPELLTEAEWRKLWYDNRRAAGCFIDALRARGLIAEPVDPLREVLDDCWHMMTGPRGKAIDALTAELRARGVTVAKGAGA